jgi:dihydrofolate reductase
MGTIVVFENVTLDGVTQDPTGEEGVSGEDWRAGLGPTDREAWAKVVLDDALGARVLLLGRRSHEYFAARWPSRDGELAEKLNGMPKYVVSTTLTDPGWHNSTVLSGDVLDEVTTLRRTVTGEIRVYASTRLVHTLIAHDLVDELRLLVFPLVTGTGDRLFGRTTNPVPLRLVDNRTVGDGLALLTYRRRRGEPAE